MDKLVGKILEIVDYSQESKNNIDIFMFILNNIDNIIENAKAIDSEKIEQIKEDYAKSILPQFIEDELLVSLDEETIRKIIDALKKRG